MAKTEFKEWFDGVLRFYRNLNFFTTGEFENIDYDQLKNRLNSAWYREKHSSGTVRGNLWLERQLIANDKDRVFYSDSEFVFRGKKFYSNLLSYLAKISRRQFQVEAPDEIWHEQKGRDHAIIELTFRFQRANHHIWLSRTSDFAQPEIIDIFNKLMEDSDHQFWMWNEGQDWLITCQNENDALQMLERGHELYEINKRWHPICEPAVEDESYAADWFSQVTEFYTGKQIEWDALKWPIYELPGSLDHIEPTLFFERGVNRYQKGDFAGAWHDFVVAGSSDFLKTKNKLDMLDIRFNG